jgi:polyhydroxybutyrate depolymerase
MDAKLMREWTGYEFDQLADQHGFVVVYPDGYKRNWNDCHSRATFAAHTENIDDMGFVKGLIAREVAQHQIDGKHVYVLGYSNGGQMVLRLALQAPEQVAGNRHSWRQLTGSRRFLMPGAGIRAPASR